jgi:hypothetical protein
MYLYPYLLRKLISVKVGSLPPSLSLSPLVFKLSFVDDTMRELELGAVRYDDSSTAVGAE